MIYKSVLAFKTCQAVFRSHSSGALPVLAITGFRFCCKTNEKPTFWEPGWGDPRCPRPVFVEKQMIFRYFSIFFDIFQCVSLLRLLGAILGVLGPTWRQLGPTWGKLGTNMAPRWDRIGADLTPAWDQLETSLGPLW